jgi:hypothetical protein
MIRTFCEMLVTLFIDTKISWNAASQLGSTSLIAASIADFVSGSFTPYSAARPYSSTG